MTIIAILLTIAVPRYFNSIDRSKEVTLRGPECHARCDRQVLRRYRRATETLDELVAKKYLRAIPADPIHRERRNLADRSAAGPQEDRGVRRESGAPGKALDGSNFQDW